MHLKVYSVTLTDLNDFLIERLKGIIDIKKNQQNNSEYKGTLVSRFNASWKDPDSLYISNKLLLLKCYKLVNKYMYLFHNVSVQCSDHYNT